MGALTYTELEKGKIADNAQNYGGSFVRHLSRALQSADIQNNARIKMTFGFMLDEYLHY